MAIALRCLAAAAVLSLWGCASLPPGSNFPRHESHALEAHEKLDRALNDPGAKAGESGYRMLANGIDGLTARLQLIDAAERTLDLQYYIFRGDESGTLIAHALLRAADRGVRVRILVDDGDTAKGDESLFTLAAHPSVEIRVFNPFEYRGHNRVLRALDFAWHKPRLDHRMHNKLFVADDSVALIGGRNIGDQYFQIDPQSQFGDDEVVVAGPMVGRLSGVFDEFWNDDLSIPANALDPRIASPASLDAYRAAMAANPPGSGFQQDLLARVATGEPVSGMTTGRDPLIWASAQLVYDSPDKSSVEEGESAGRLIYAPVAARTREVQSELLMITPYFVPSHRERALLRDVRGRGAIVSVLTNSMPSAPEPAAHAGYSKLRRELLGDGVKLHEIRALLGSSRGSGQSRAVSSHGNFALHAKLYVFDRKALFVGSMNFDQRSKQINTEIGLLISSPKLAADAGVRYDELTQLQNAYTVTMSDSGKGRRPALLWTSEEDGVVVKSTREPARSAWQRLKVTLLSLLPLDTEL